MKKAPLEAETLDLKKLRAFYLTAKHGSLRAAASRLRLTISAISLQISHLENDLQISLFRRGPNKLVLTPTGESFVLEVEAIFSQIEKSLAAVSSIVRHGGGVTLSIGNDLSRYFTPKITNFVTRNPTIDLTINVRETPETLALVEKGEADIGIGYFRRLPKSIVRDVILRSPFSLICAPNHPLLNQDFVTFEDLGRHKLLLLPTHSTTGMIVHSVFAKAGVKPKSFIELGNCQTAREFAEQGVGVAIVHSICLGHQETERLRNLNLDLGSTFGEVDIAAIYRRGRTLSSMHRLLLDELLDSA